MADNHTELAELDWMASQVSYVFTEDGGIAALSADNGLDRLVVLGPGSRERDRLPIPCTSLQSAQSQGRAALAIAASTRRGSDRPG